MSWLQHDSVGDQQQSDHVNLAGVVFILHTFDDALLAHEMDVSSSVYFSMLYLKLHVYGKV